MTTIALPFKVCRESKLFGTDVVAVMETVSNSVVTNERIVEVAVVKCTV